MRMPVLFVGHGNPMNAIERNEFHENWIALGERLPRPRAILCVSAHWETRDAYVTATDAPETIHDFYGFPRALFEVRYPAPGEPALARRVAELVASEARAARPGPRARPRGLERPRRDVSRKPTFPSSSSAWIRAGPAGITTSSRGSLRRFATKACS